MLIFRPEARIEEATSDLIVNTVNTVGVMGKGVALSMAQKYPEILAPYKKACAERRIAPGTIQRVPLQDGRAVINLATKQDWRDPSKYAWVGSGLLYLNRYLNMEKNQGKSITLPMPGAGYGQLNPFIVQDMLHRFLHLSARNHEITICAERVELIDKPIFFAGIGARVTPKPVLSVMTETGGLLGELGIGLRSGGAIGADSAFHEGAMATAASSEIFLTKPNPQIPDGIIELDPVFMRIALNYHPAPDYFTKPPPGEEWRRDGAHKLMARNGCQIFGRDFTNPSNLVICYTEGGKAGGGTGQAIRLADSIGIPVIDLGKPELAGIRASDVVELALSKITAYREAIGYRNTGPDIAPMELAGP